MRLRNAIVAACRDIRKSEGLTRVCLSGGSFQNVRLLESTVRGLEQAGFEVTLATATLTSWQALKVRPLELLRQE